MTSRVQATISHNHPITVSKQKDQFSAPELITQTEGTPGIYHGEKTASVDIWFSGNERIIIKETPVPEVMHQPV